MSGGYLCDCRCLPVFDSYQDIYCSNQDTCVTDKFAVININGIDNYNNYYLLDCY